MCCVTATSGKKKENPTQMYEDLTYRLEKMKKHLEELGGYL